MLCTCFHYFIWPKPDRVGSTSKIIHVIIPELGQTVQHFVIYRYKFNDPADGLDSPVQNSFFFAFRKLKSAPDKIFSLLEPDNINVRCIHEFLFAQDKTEHVWCICEFILESDKKHRTVRSIGRVVKSMPDSLTFFLHQKVRSMNPFWWPCWWTWQSSAKMLSQSTQRHRTYLLFGFSTEKIFVRCCA